MPLVPGGTHSSMDVHQNKRDGENLYRVLREEVIPLYYQRDRDGLPRGWIKRMKRTIRTLGWRFNANRMVMDYTLNCYIPAPPGALPATCGPRAELSRTGFQPVGFLFAIAETSNPTG